MHPETQYFAASFTCGSQLHERPTTIHHWQLRDLVSPGDCEDEAYVVHAEQVVQYNAKTQQSKTVMSLDYKPNSMTCRHGYLAAGGLRSQLEVRNLRTNSTCFKGNVGGTVNNALHIGKHSNGDLRLFVCNNDDTIKVYTLPTMAAVATIRCHVPINYASLSPDGTQLVCVGDCPSTLTYRATPSGYTLASSLTEASDVGMCCGWSHWGALVASAHQDGRTVVWDARSGCVVAKYRFQCAVRNVKFSAGPVDLMAVAEHEDAVHLVDSRRWDAVQTLEPGAACHSPMSIGGVQYHTAEQDISGIGFSGSGRRLWVGLEQGLVAFDVDERSRRQFGVAEML